MLIICLLELTNVSFDCFERNLLTICQFVNSSYLCNIELQRKTNKINEIGSVTKSLPHRL